MYGAELGFSSHDEEGNEEAGDVGVVGHIDGSGGVGGVSPVSSDLQHLPPTVLHSSPSASASLHSAQTSNDDPDQLQVSLMPTKQSIN